MTKRKLGEETPSTEPSVSSPSPLFSPGLTERQQIALAMKLSGESSQGDNFTTPRPSKVCPTVFELPYLLQNLNKSITFAEVKNFC